MSATREQLAAALQAAQADAQKAWIVVATLIRQIQPAGGEPVTIHEGALRETTEKWELSRRGFRDNIGNGTPEYVHGEAYRCVPRGDEPRVQIAQQIPPV